MCMNADNADVTFIVKAEHLPAHRIILATRSEYFRAMLYGALKESKQNEIALDVPVEAFKFLIKYIYTGRLSLKQMKNTDILDILETDTGRNHFQLDVVRPAPKPDGHKGNCKNQQFGNALPPRAGSKASNAGVHVLQGL
uniref:BTB domain-containing protein n=1 Tax=Anopheles merus TaxID=30066 RepID=A0A182UPH2_ANOME